MNPRRSALRILYTSQTQNHKPALHNEQFGNTDCRKKSKKVCSKKKVHSPNLANLRDGRSFSHCPWASASARLPRRLHHPQLGSTFTWQISKHMNLYIYIYMNIYRECMCVAENQRLPACLINSDVLLDPVRPNELAAYKIRAQTWRFSDTEHSFWGYEWSTPSEVCKRTEEHLVRQVSYCWQETRRSISVCSRFASRPRISHCRRQSSQL